MNLQGMMVNHPIQIHTDHQILHQIPDHQTMAIKVVLLPHPLLAQHPIMGQVMLGQTEAMIPMMDKIHPVNLHR